MEDREIKHRLKHIEKLLWIIIEGEGIIMANIDEVLQDVTDESTVGDSLIALTNGIHDQLTALLAGSSVPPALQTKIDAVFTGIESNKAKLTAAVTANTPAAADTGGGTPPA